jgi:hypothetical protein
MIPDTFAGWVQLILNAGAIVTGGIIWKQYFENLKATVGSKQAEVDLLREKSDYWHERASELEKQSPAAVERVLAERIEIREREIERLSGDRTESSKELGRLEQEVLALNRAMAQMKGFRQVLAMEAPDPGDPDYDEYMEYLQSRSDQVVDIEVVYMGSVGVDSGQLMITDPCYIDSEWLDEPFEDDRVYKDETSGAIVRWGQDFMRFDEPLEPYGESPEALIQSGRLVQLPPPPKPDTFRYSYNGACQATLSEGYGELVFNKGYVGAGVVFGSGWGDGMYEVYGEKHDGRIVRVYVNTGADPVPLPRVGSTSD